MIKKEIILTVVYWLLKSKLIKIDSCIKITVCHCHHLSGILQLWSLHFWILSKSNRKPMVKAPRVHDHYLDVPITILLSLILPTHISRHNCQSCKSFNETGPTFPPLKNRIDLQISSAPRFSSNTSLCRKRTDSRCTHIDGKINSLRVQYLKDIG